MVVPHLLVSGKEFGEAGPLLGREKGRRECTYNLLGILLAFLDSLELIGDFIDEVVCKGNMRLCSLLQRGQHLAVCGVQGAT